MCIYYKYKQRYISLLSHIYVTRELNTIDYQYITFNLLSNQFNFIGIFIFGHVLLNSCFNWPINTYVDKNIVCRIEI